MSVYPEGVSTDDLLSRKPGFLLSAMHSRAFRWFFAGPLVFLLLGFLLLQAESDLADFFVCVMYGKEGGWDFFYFYLFTF